MSKDLTYELRHTVSSTIKINQAVIDQVDDEWRKTFYNLKTPADVIEHVAYNLLQGLRLSQLDGFADLPDNYAVLIDGPDYECDTIEKV